MNSYRISRNGQMFGPYTEADIAQYVRSGNIAPTDLAQAEGSEAWVPVADLLRGFGAAGAVPPSPPVRGAAAGFGVNGYPDPPDLPWWVALLLAVVTGGIFFVIWDIVQATWVRRVQPASRALALYIALAVVYLVRLPANWESVHYNLFGGPPVGPHHGFLLFVVWLGLYVASRTTIRQDVLVHFNISEPIGLELSSFLVYLFGGLYLQYKFNQINQQKRGMRVGVVV